jgi:hypothetical protein
LIGKNRLSGILLLERNETGQQAAPDIMSVSTWSGAKPAFSV